MPCRLIFVNMMMPRFRRLLFFVFFGLAPIALRSQAERFNAGILAGLNFSELEGAGTINYFGLNAGLTGGVRLSKQLQSGIEFLFSQNGEYILPAYYPPIRYRSIRLNHLEIPVHLDWLLRTVRRDNVYNWNLNLGVAYARLIAHHAEDLDKNDVSKQIIYTDKDAWLLQAGMIYYFTKKIGFNLKASLPIRQRGLSWTLAARIVCFIR